MAAPEDESSAQSQSSSAAAAAPTPPPPPSSAGDHYLAKCVLRPSVVLQVAYGYFRSRSSRDIVFGKVRPLPPPSSCNQLPAAPPRYYLPSASKSRIMMIDARQNAAFPISGSSTVIWQVYMPDWNCANGISKPRGTVLKGVAAGGVSVIGDVSTTSRLSRYSPTKASRRRHNKLPEPAQCAGMQHIPAGPATSGGRMAAPK